MKNVYESVAGGGMDVHYKFSSVTMRDAQGRVVRRERLEHPHRRPAVVFPCVVGCISVSGIIRSVSGAARDFPTGC